MLLLLLAPPQAPPPRSPAQADTWMYRSKLKPIETKRLRFEVEAQQIPGAENRCIIPASESLARRNPCFPLHAPLPTPPRSHLHHCRHLRHIMHQHVLHPALQRDRGGGAAAAGPQHLNRHNAALRVKVLEADVAAVFLLARGGWRNRLSGLHIRARIQRQF